MRRILRKAAVAGGILLALAAGSAAATTVLFNDFSDLSSMDLNGNAAGATTGDGSVLRLTRAVQNQSGSAFSLTQISAATFSTFFSFRITNPGGSLFDCNDTTGADGLVFVVQNVSSNVGGAGQGIGYAGINPSVGVEFDTWCNGANHDPSSNHLGIDLNGNVNHGWGAPYTANVAPRFDDQNIWYAWIDYDGTTLEVRANESGIRPLAPTLTRELSGLNGTQTVAQILGQDNAYIGFTSGTGADWGNHDILTWEYRDNFNPVNNIPEPATLGHLAIGLAGLVIGRHSRKSSRRRRVS